MPDFRKSFQDFLRDDGAATAIEYGLIAAATSVVVATTMGNMTQSSLWEVFGTISEGLADLTTQ